MPKPQFQGIITFPILFGIVAAIVILASAAVSATLQAPSGRPLENISKPLCRINPDLAVCKNLPSLRTPPSPSASPKPTTTPQSSPAPEQNKISWQTPQVSLEADNFYIIADDKKFLGNVAKSRLTSDPGNSTYTTLEIEWTENGVPMRFYMYFNAKDGNWNVSEIRTYNGKNPGDWIFYDGFLGGKLGEPYINKVLGIKSKPVGSYNVPGEIHFENIKLLPFRNQ